MGSGLLMTALTLITSFASTPWILHWLGNERFGAFRVLMDWFGWLTILDLGIIGSVTARLGPKLGAGDEEGVFGILVAGFRVYIRIALAMLAAGAILVVALPYFVPLKTVSAHELRMAAWIMLIPTAWVPFSVFRALTEARQRGYLVNLLLALQAMLTTAFLVFTAWAGWGLIGQGLANTLAVAPTTAVLVYLGMRRYRGVLSTKPAANAIEEVRSLNWPTFWFNISGRLGLLSDNMVIGSMLGPAAVAPFFLTQRIAQIAQTQLQAIGNATWAGLVELYAQGQTAKFCSRMVDLTALVSGIGIAVLGPIAAYNGRFIALWVGAGSYAGEWVNAIACVNIWMWAIVSLWCWPIGGAGHIAQWLPYALWFSGINIVVSVAATAWVGLAGPLIGTFAAFVLIDSWALPRVLARIFDPSLGSLWKAALAPMLWGAPYSALIWWIARSHTPHGWLGLAAEASLAGLGGLFLWWLSLGSDLRQQWQFRFRSAWAR